MLHRTKTRNNLWDRSLNNGHRHPKTCLSGTWSIKHPATLIQYPQSKQFSPAWASVIDSQATKPKNLWAGRFKTHPWTMHCLTISILITNCWITKILPSEKDSFLLCTVFVVVSLLWCLLMHHDGSTFFFSVALSCNNLWWITMRQISSSLMDHDASNLFFFDASRCNNSSSSSVFKPRPSLLSWS